MKKFLYLIILINLALPVLAQEDRFMFEKFTVVHGLPTDFTRGICQDKEGYVWIGSTNAILRFDGFSFKSFKHEIGNNVSLTSGFDNVIIEDRSGYIWAGTSTGLCKLNRVSEEFKRFAPADPSAPIFRFDIQCIFEDSKGVLWVGANMGINNIDSLQTKLEPFAPEKFKDVFPNIAFKSINEDNNGVLWFGTGIGLMKYDRNSREVIPVWLDPNPPALLGKNWNTGDYAIQCIYKDEEGMLWAGSFGGTLLKINPLTGNTVSFILQDSVVGEKYPVQSICSEDNNTLWIATYSGLLLFDKSRGQILTRCVYDENNKAGLSDSRLTSVLKDKSGVLWAGTLNGGLNKLNRTRFSFNKYLKRSWGAVKSFTTALPFKDLVVSKTGSMFAGTTSGIEEIKPGLEETVKHGPFEAINVLMEDSHENLWIAIKQYSGGGLYKKSKDGRLFPVLDSGGAIFSKEIQCLHETKNGKIFFGSEFYLFEINPQKNTASMVFRTNRRIYSMYHYKDNILCLGTLAGGLIFFNTDNKSLVKHFNPDEKKPNSIGDNSILSIYTDTKNRLWIGVGTGLNKYDEQADGFKIYNDKQGLGNTTILSITEDNFGNLWLGTGDGISKFNPETETFKNYDYSYGLLESYHYAGAKNKKGEIFFRAKTGLSYFNPDSISDNPFIPPVVITEVKIHNNPYKFSKELNLSYSENYISLEFAGLSYISPDKNRYAYMMEGVDKNWVNSGKRRYVSYTSLDPGSYVFHVKASNNDGVWNDTGTTLKIVIAPPWYKTYWAYGMYLIFFISLVYGWRRYDLKRQNLKYQVQLEHKSAVKEKELSQMKSRFFTNISHEFRTPLTLIIGPAEKIITSAPNDETVKQAELMKKNAVHLLGLVNQLLDISKLDEGRLKLRVSSGNFMSFVRGIVSIFESYAESKDINLKVKSGKDEIMGYFDREKIEKVLINIISNALKFTSDGGQISVSLDEVSGKAVIKVRDTGIGINADELPKLFDRFYQVDSTHTRERGGTGIGLSLAKELVELHKGKIRIDSIEGEWTEFTIELPIAKEFFNEDEIIESEDEHLDETRYLELVNQVESGIKSSLPSVVSANGGKEISSTDGEKPIILVVEDNEDVRRYIRDILETEYIIEEAANGEQGYRKAEAIIPDLIIGDIMMPKMDGYEMTKKLREDEKTCHIPIILLTAKSDHQSKLEGFERGADAYMVKPFDTNELKIRILNLITIRKKLQEKFGKGEKIPVREHEEKKLSDLNEKFINRVIEVMEKHIGEEEFSIEEFSSELYMSRTQLHRKLKALTGKSASRYLRSFRLKAAKKMIEEGRGTISEIAYDVGFSSPVYFSKCFKDEYGYPPSGVAVN